MEAILKTYQLGLPKVQVIPTNPPGLVKIPTNPIHVPKPNIRVPPTRVLTPRQQREVERLSRINQRKAEREARRELRRNRPSYFERHGERRLDTILRGVGDVLTVASSAAEVINTLKGRGGYYTDESGTRQQLTQEDYDVLREQLQLQQQQGFSLQDIQQMMLQANNNPPQKDNTGLYIALGVGAVLIVGVALIVSTKK